MSVVIFIAATGGAVVPLLAGRIYDVNGSYNAAFLVYGVLAVIGLLLTALLKRPQEAG